MSSVEVIDKQLEIRIEALTKKAKLIVENNPNDTKRIIEAMRRVGEYSLVKTRKALSGTIKDSLSPVATDKLIE